MSLPRWDFEFPALWHRWEKQGKRKKKKDKIKKTSLSGF
jgi:hypothetical protein